MRDARVWWWGDRQYCKCCCPARYTDNGSICGIEICSCRPHSNSCKGLGATQHQSECSESSSNRFRLHVGQAERAPCCVRLSVFLARPRGELSCSRSAQACHTGLTAMRQPIRVVLDSPTVLDQDASQCDIGNLGRCSSFPTSTSPLVGISRKWQDQKSHLFL